MISIEEVAEQVRRSLAGRATDLTLRAETSLQDIGLSSLQISEILFRLEELHGVEFDTARAADVHTLGDIAMLGEIAMHGAGGTPA